MGVVDCANEVNSDLCREYEIMSYPTLRYFVPHTPRGSYGNDTRKSYNVEGLRVKLIEKLLNTTAEPDWPSFASYSGDSVFDIWSKVPDSVKYAAFFVESKPKENEDTNSSKNKGVEFILDMSGIPEVYASRVQSDESTAQQLQVPVTPGISIVTRANDIIPLTPDSIDNTREKRLEAVLKYLQVNGVHVPDDYEETNVAEVLDVLQETRNTPDQGDTVYQVDLETALRYSLERDVPLKASNIDGERLEALKSYVKVLTKYFPFHDDKGRKFLNSLNSSLTSKSFTPIEFQDTVRNLINQQDPFLIKNKSTTFVGCSSRFPGLRGYPCTLWTLFHTLSVAAGNRTQLSSDPKEVLHAMQGYIKHFFSCTECSNNFAKETGNLEESVSTLDDSILYLWKTHNHVNFRLHQYPGNRTEDPEHPKIQFPSITNCPQCYTSSGDWNETSVLNYLKSIYTQISGRTTTEIYPNPTQNHSQTKRETGKTHATPLIIDTRYFNMFDISLCVMLYFASVAILILVGLKFCLKKSHRKKTYIYDILSKA